MAFVFLPLAPVPACPLAKMRNLWGGDLGRHSSYEEALTEKGKYNHNAAAARLVDLSARSGRLMCRFRRGAV